jgi:hypothetical protein
MELTYDELAILQLATIRLLSEAAKGNIDLNELAKRELANRGMDKDGKWVGFDEAKKLHGIS